MKAPAENFSMGRGGRWAHWVGWGGGGGVAAAVALRAADVDLPEIMLRQALAALNRISWRCLRFSSSTWEWSSSWTRLSSCPLRADGAVVQTCRKLWCSTFAVLGQGGDMPAVVNDRCSGCRRCSSYGCGQVGSRTQWKCLRFSSSRRLRTFQLRNRDGYAAFSGRAPRREVVLASRRGWGRDQEGVDVVNEFFCASGPLGERWRWWRRERRGWGCRRGAAGAVHRQGC